MTEDRLRKVLELERSKRFSDRAVIFYRRLMLRLIKDNEEGKALPAHDPSLDFQQRGASFTVPASFSRKASLKPSTDSPGWFS